MTWPLLLGREIPAAMAQVQAWGYPRVLGEEEAEAVWFQPHPQIRGWVELVVSNEREMLGVLHLCVDPAVQRRLYARPVIRGIESLARSLRLDSLWALEDPTFTIPSQVGGYLERWGWEKTCVGYRLLFPR